MTRPTIDKTQTLTVIPDCQTLHELMVVYAEDIFARKGEIDPTWLIACGPHVAYVKTPFEGPQSKHLVSIIMQEAMKEMKCHAYSFISEVWMTALHTPDINSEEFKARAAKIDAEGVRALPKAERDDCLFLVTYDLTGGFRCTRWIVTIRHQNRGLNFLGPRIDENTGHLSGKFVNLLREET